jgi:hypothetical protein
MNRIFEILEDRATKLNLPMADGVANSLVSHIRMLKFTASGTYKRSDSVVESSWAYVLSEGTKHGLFKDLDVTDAEREEFKSFLKPVN